MMTSSTESGSRRSAAVRQLRSVARSVLSRRERAELATVVGRYRNSGSVADLADSLWALLDTPAKRPIAQLLRSVLPASHVTEFDRRLGAEFVMDRPVIAGRAETIRRKDELTDARVNGSSSRPRQRNVVSDTEYPTTGGHRRYLDSSSSLPPHQPLASHRTTDRHRRAATVVDHQSLPMMTSRRTNDDVRFRATDVRVVTLDRQRPGGELGLGIRGGAEHGLGIYVSSMDPGSPAERAGLRVGDMILRVNGLSFQTVTNSQAVQILRGSKSMLVMEVWHAGRVPGSYETHLEYSWIDASGRPTSPPDEVDNSERYQSTGMRKSGLMLLKGVDERKVNVTVGGLRKLGITVRGGNEYGLGIYVSRVDEGSAAEHAGLQIGDQILDVNGISFLDISHSDAVACLRSSRQLMITVKDVGKIPHAMTSYDKTNWIDEQDLTSEPGKSVEKSSNGYSSTASTLSKIRDRPNGSVFTRGVGSQLMLRSYTGQTAQMSIINERARRLLTDENEASSLNYYVTEYVSGNMAIESLVFALNQLLNTKQKRAILKDVRGLILPRDIDNYDTLVNEQNATTKNRNRRRYGSLDSLFRLPDARPEHSISTINSRDDPTAVERRRHRRPAESDNDELDTLRRVLDDLTASSIISDESLFKPQTSERLINGVGNTYMSARANHWPRMTSTTPATSREGFSVVNGSNEISSSNTHRVVESRAWIDDAEVLPYFAQVHIRTRATPFGRNVHKTDHGNYTMTKTQSDSTDRGLTLSSSVYTQTDFNSSLSRKSASNITTTSSNSRTINNNIYLANAYTPQQTSPSPPPVRTKTGVAGTQTESDVWSEFGSQFEKPKLSAMFSYDESLPETSTVTLNHHQHETTSSEATTPSRRRSLTVNDDHSSRHPRSFSTPPSQLGRLGLSSDVSMSRSSVNLFRELRGDPAVSDQMASQQVVDVYAVPSKSRTANPAAREYEVNAERSGLSAIPPHTAVTRPPKATRIRRQDGVSGAGSKSGMLRAQTAAISRHRLPAEYLDGSIETHAEGIDGVAPTKLINTAKNRKSRRHDDIRNVEDTILPPPEVFSDKKRENTGPSQLASEAVNHGDGLSSITIPTFDVYSEVNDDVSNDRMPEAGSFIPSNGVTNGTKQTDVSSDVATPRLLDERTPQITTTANSEPVNDSTVENSHQRVKTFPREQQHQPEDFEQQWSNRRTVRVEKTRPILGIAIEGGANTRVPLPRIAKVQENGSAHGTELNVGQSIVEVDGRSLIGLRHIDCARAIAESFRNKTKSYMEIVIVDTANGLIV